MLGWISLLDFAGGGGSPPTTVTASTVDAGANAGHGGIPNFNEALYPYAEPEEIVKPLREEVKKTRKQLRKANVSKRSYSNSQNQLSNITRSLNRMEKRLADIRSQEQASAEIQKYREISNRIAEARRRIASQPAPEPLPDPHQIYLQRALEEDEKLLNDPEKMAQIMALLFN